MGQRAWVVEVRDEKDLKEFDKMTETIDSLSGVDNSPFMVSAYEKDGKIFVCMSTDGTTFLEFYHNFDLMWPIYIDELECKYTKYGAKIIGAKYFKSDKELKLALIKDKSESKKIKTKKPIKKAK